VASQVFQVFQDGGALAVFSGRQLLDDACALLTGASERRIDVRYAHVDDVSHGVVVWATRSAPTSAITTAPSRPTRSWER
jgi:hypothetical protein